jgi:hypothetical protein
MVIADMVINGKTETVEVLGGGAEVSARTYYRPATIALVQMPVELPHYTHGGWAYNSQVWVNANQLTNVRQVPA